MTQSHPLFGGAISLLLPNGYVDASQLRQVPDNQEVFVSSTDNSSVIVELLEEEMDQQDAPLFHLLEMVESATDLTLVARVSLPITQNMNLQLSRITLFGCIVVNRRPCICGRRHPSTSFMPVRTRPNSMKLRQPVFIPFWLSCAFHASRPICWCPCIGLWRPIQERRITRSRFPNFLPSSIRFVSMITLCFNKRIRNDMIFTSTSIPSPVECLCDHHEMLHHFSFGHVATERNGKKEIDTPHTTCRIPCWENCFGITKVFIRSSKQFSTWSSSGHLRAPNPKFPTQEQTKTIGIP